MHCLQTSAPFHASLMFCVPDCVHKFIHDTYIIFVLNLDPCTTSQLLRQLHDQAQCSTLIYTIGAHSCFLHAGGPSKYTCMYKHKVIYMYKMLIQFLDYIPKMLRYYHDFFGPGQMLV